MKKLRFKSYPVLFKRAKYSLLLCCLLGMGSTLAQLRISDSLVVGAARTNAYLPLLRDKQVGLVVNQTARVGEQHLIDFLQAKGVDIELIFSPEHGLRGEASAGEEVLDGVDQKSGLPVVSLYGAKKKPTPEDMEGLEVMIFDIQDVGARFYTYISTLTYIMEACADAGVELIVLDRPNPNGFYIDGPILDTNYRSFVGMHPVPIVHGCTIGEYARMVEGEGWLKCQGKLRLTVVPVYGYDHSTAYSLPVAPSPNLKNDTSIILYPTLCLFEGTTVSVGRGTNKPFQLIGAPYFSNTTMHFVPQSRPESIYPKHEGQKCYGFDLSVFGISYLPAYKALYLPWIQQSYEMAPDSNSFFNSFFTKLAGTPKLQEQIQAGWTDEEIRASWQDDLKRYKRMRRKYLLYRDFED